MAINQLKTGAFLSYLSIGLSSAISIVYTPVMLRLLGQSDYGLYSLVASVVAYLGLFNFGFGSAYIKYFSVYKTNGDTAGITRLNGMFLIIFTFLGLLAVVAGLVLVFNSEIVFGNKLTDSEQLKAKYLTIIMVINTAITFPAIVFNSYITAKEKFLFQKLLIIGKSVISPLVVIPVLIMGYGSVCMAIMLTLVSITVEIINIVFCFRKTEMRFSFQKFEKGQLKELFVFSSFIFMNLVVNQINWNVDRFIIGWFKGTLEVAVYSIAGQLNTYFITFSTSISGVYIPRVNQMIARKCSDWELTELFARIGRIQFLILVYIISLLVFFGKAFITLWAGEDYVDSYYMALVLIVPLILPLIQNLGIEIQRAKNMHKFRSWVYLFIAIGNIFISIPLVKAFGGIGAAAGTAIALTIGNTLIMNWYYHNVIGLNIKYFLKQIGLILPSLLLPSIIGTGIFWFIDLIQIFNFLIFAFVFSVAFAISVWLMGMNEYEKQLVLNPLQRIINKIKKHNN